MSVECGAGASTALVFLISKEAAAADDLGNLGWHHLVPAFVPGGDALEHIPGKDRQIFGIIVIKLHETATTDEIVEQWLLAGAGRRFWFG